MRAQLEAALPDAQVMDFRESNPGITRGLDNATSILSLICLVALVLGAIGVAMAMHAHLEQHMDTLAILKALGADSADLLRIFLLQTMSLGLAGGLLGVAAGVGVMVALPAAFGPLLTMNLQIRISLAIGAGGPGNGPADHVALLFAAAARCARSASRAGAAQAGGAGPDRHRRLVCALVGAPPATGNRRRSGGRARRHRLGAYRFAQSRRVVCSAVHASRFVVLLVLAMVALRALRFFLNRTRLHLPSSLRHGLANLYRPGNQSAAVLAALGTGVMLILAVYLMQKGLLRDLQETASPSLPNVLLVDMQTNEVAGVKEFFAHQPGVSQAIDSDPHRSRALHLH